MSSTNNFDPIDPKEYFLPGLIELEKRDVSPHDTYNAFVSIGSEEQLIAASWLLWSSFKNETDYEPPSFNLAYRSRLANIDNEIKRNQFDNRDERLARIACWMQAIVITKELTACQIIWTRSASLGLLTT